jgi:hypothetical protein
VTEDEYRGARHAADPKVEQVPLATLAKWAGFVEAAINLRRPVVLIDGKEYG